MSRRVVPACGNLCFFCPSLRARSRQPVKRYKKMLSEILKDAEPNDRKLGKLCEYASKNPLRIPKITHQLEQRCYKDLRNENFGPVRVVLCIYRKFLSSCKGQMPLYASSLLGIVRTLLEQTRQDEMRILGCNILVGFINSQVCNGWKDEVLICLTQFDLMKNLLITWPCTWYKCIWGGTHSISAQQNSPPHQ
jgi:hypothetical protein